MMPAARGAKVVSDRVWHQLILKTMEEEEPWRGDGPAVHQT